MLKNNNYLQTRTIVPLKASSQYLVCEKGRLNRALYISNSSTSVNQISLNTITLFTIKQIKLPFYKI